MSSFLDEDRIRRHELGQITDEELSDLYGEVVPIKPKSTTPAFDAFDNQIRTAERGPSFREHIITADAFCKISLPEKRYFLGHIIGEQQMILIPGWRGTGKTWFCLSLADSITRGVGFGPWKAGDAAPVMYVDAELPEVDLQKRITMLNPTQEREHPLYIYNDCMMTTKGVKRASLLDEAWQRDLKEELLKLQVKVVFFDNISSLTAGIDENLKAAWDPVNQFLLEMRFAGITSILAHHVSKTGGQRGTSGREDNIDMSILLKQPPDYSPDQGCDFIASFSKARVPGEYLSELGDVRLTLACRNDVAEWTYCSVKTAAKELIISMLREGYKYDEIASSAGVTKPYITRVKQAAQKDGILPKI